MANSIKTKTLGLVSALAMMAGTASAESLLIGIAAEPYPPFTEKSADGNWVGWEVEIVDALCAAMEKDCEIVEVAWDGIIPALLSKKMDVIIASMSITEERLKTIDFSNKYYNSPGAVVAPKSLDVDGTAESMAPLITGIQVSTIYTNYAEKHYPDTRVKTYSTLDEHNQDLAAGRIDAVIADSIAMGSFLESDAGACCEIKAEIVDEAIFGPGIGAGIRKGEDELKADINAAIDKIRADGTYDEISAKYFNFDIYGG